MRVGDTIGTLLKAAVLCGCAYAIWQWDVINPQDDDVTNFAEKTCTDEIGRRFNASMVNVYSVKETNIGYVVRASVTLPKGTVAKVYCLTNTHGGVREITIEER